MKKYLILLLLVILLGCGENSSSPSQDLTRPLNLSAQLEEGLVIRLTWDDACNSESGFIIQRRVESGNYSDLAEVGEDVEEYFDTELSTNTTYYYRVAAIKDDNQSDWSNSAIAHTPQDVLAPSGLQVTDLTSESVTLQWNDNTSNEDSFVIQRKEGYGVYEEIAEVNANTIQYTDNEVDAVTEYFYRVAAVIGSQYTGWSEVVEITTPPSITGLEFGTDVSFEILTWNLREFPLNDEVTVGYVVEIINQADPDIIALQEINSNNYFNQIIDQLDGWQGYKANSASYDIDLAYLYKTDAIDVTSIYEIFEDDYYYFPRRPLVAEIEVDGVNLIVINNHLKASGGSENEERRRQACILLEEYITTNHNYDNVIVLGDLNDELTDNGEDNVFNSFLQYPQKYLFTDINIAEGSANYWSYPSWPSHLDHILITNELFDEFEEPAAEIETIRVDLFLSNGWNEYENNISDHRPVGLKITF